MSYISTEVWNRLSLVTIKLNLCSISSVGIMVGGLEHGGFTKKDKKMGAGHTKFEKLMMSHIRANLHFLICRKVCHKNLYCTC